MTKLNFGFVSAQSVSVNGPLPQKVYNIRIYLFLPNDFD